MRQQIPGNAGKIAQKTGKRSSTSASSEPTELWTRVRQGLSWQDLDGPGVEQARRSYLAQPGYLPMINERAALYLYYIVEELERRELPMELALLAMVESALDPFATSHFRAAGIWQIMPATGEHLGLQQDWWFDGRRDLRASTNAALDYLESLHADLDNDWLLALAAYNAGKGRILSAMKANARKGKPTDYWSLSLPRETRRFVPRVVALAQIFSEPEVYGITLPELPNQASFVVVDSGGQVEMARAAELAGIDLDTLRALNPGQLRWASKPEGAQELLLPPESAARFRSGIALLDPADRVRWRHYTIRRGDSLIKIARKYDTRVDTLKAANNMRGSLIRAGDTLLIPYGGDWAKSLAIAGDDARVRKGYRVKRGDSLYRIAGRFKVSIDDILAWNSLERDAYLQPGQQLTLYLDEG